MRRVVYHVGYVPLLVMVSLLFVVVIDLFVHIALLSPLVSFWVGIALIILGPALLVWAQHTRRLIYGQDVSFESFYTGPYTVSRHPTYLSFFFLLFGVSFLLNTLVGFLFVWCVFFVFTFVVIPREERLLIDSHERAYRSYMERVRMWF